RGHGGAFHILINIRRVQIVGDGAGGGQHRLQGQSIGLRHGDGRNPIAGRLKRPQETSGDVVVDDGGACARLHGIGDLLGKKERPAGNQRNVTRNARRKVCGVTQPAIINRGGDARGRSGECQFVGGIRRRTLPHVGNRHWHVCGGGGENVHARRAKVYRGRTVIRKAGQIIVLVGGGH